MALLLKIQTDSWGWHGSGLSNADSSNQSFMGAKHPACLAPEEFGGAHFCHSFGAPGLPWRAMQGHIKGHVFGPPPQPSWNQGNNISRPASSPGCVLVISSGAVPLWATAAPLLHPLLFQPPLPSFLHTSLPGEMELTMGEEVINVNCLTKWLKAWAFLLSFQIPQSWC